MHVNAKGDHVCVLSGASTSESGTDTSWKDEDDDHAAHRLPIRHNAGRASEQLGRGLDLLLIGEAGDVLRRQREVRLLWRRGRRRQHLRLPVSKAT